MKLILIRHGESMGNIWDEAHRDDTTNFLTLRGVKQAELASYDIRRLCERHDTSIDEVITTEATRARHTATTIMQAMGDWKRHYIMDERLNEWGLEIPPEDYWDKRENQDLFRAKVNEWYEETIVGINNTNLCVLIVSHYYTMSVLFERFRIELGLIEGSYDLDSKDDGPTIPNAIPFFYDTQAGVDVEMIGPGYFSKRW